MAVDMYAQIGAEIRKRREAIGLSQAQLADRIGVGRTSITMIERGAQSLLVHQLIEIAAALRSNPPALLANLIQEPEAVADPQPSPEIEDLLVELHQSITRITRR